MGDIQTVLVSYRKKSVAYIYLWFEQVDIETTV